MKTTPLLSLPLVATLLMSAMPVHANWPSCIPQRRLAKKVYSCLATGRIFSYRDRLPYMVNDFGACLIPNDPKPEGGQLGNYEWFGVSLKLDAQADGNTFFSVETPHRGVPKARSMVVGLPQELSLLASSAEMYSNNDLLLDIHCFLLPALPAAKPEAGGADLEQSEDLNGSHCMLPADACPK